MSLNGIPYFWDIPKYQYSYPKLFTSRLVIGIELWYKFIFFWFMSLVACKACCDFDKSLYDYIATIASNDGEQQEQQEQSIWKILLIIYTSPAVLRGALFRAFSVVSVMLFCIGSFRCSTVLSLDTSFSRTISVGFVCYHTLCIFESKWKKVMYPSMGLRSLKKIQQFHREGKEANKLKGVWNKDSKFLWCYSRNNMEVGGKGYNYFNEGRAMVCTDESTSTWCILCQRFRKGWFLWMNSSGLA